MTTRRTSIRATRESLRRAGGIAAVGLVLALLAASPLPAHAADVQAQVTNVATDGTLKLALPAGHAVRAGDKVIVSTDLPGLGRVTLQTHWRVTDVSGDVATAAVTGPVTGLPKPGFTAVVVTLGQSGAARAAAAGGNILDANRKKAEAGDVEAMLRLGYHYLGDVPLTAGAPDPQQAVHWLSIAAQRNNAAAACALASYFRNHKDIAQAIRFTHQAAAGGDPGCQYALGMALLNGTGLARNPAEAFKWIDKAAQAGMMPANYQIAVLYLAGVGTKRDVAHALRIFVSLAEKGVPSAMFYASMLLFPTQPQQGLAWNLKAAAAGHTMAMYQLATLYLTGHEGAKIVKNQTEARRWYAKAATAGEPESMLMLADMMEHGVGGPRQTREAARWAMKALRGHVVQVQGLLQKPQAWSAAFWKAMQTQMKEAGVYKGRIDGRFTKATALAIEAIVKQGA